ncbi:ligase-associated DNA damage response exonuclease [Salibacter sp.]|uniref:ligase-associated DNA damage response exonuclease n=1 Tax=Salibacter sp. TaxID=2010995 RepID=UPI00287009DE|nr:ligase-associated DNA damage response exonuclease [Salibacter sp.]MDR9488428.1 ligase-associated DNA damage response exonuclease [Salibacter sp.]
MSQKPLLKFNDNGIFCPKGDFYIDPWRPVKKALITHAHADHARFGSDHYLATKGSKAIMRYRLGDNIKLETVEYNEILSINGVKVSFHPAGHITGSAQIRVEYKGEVWLVTGDYKLADDGVAEAFEPVKCNTMITECTFGLPVFNWPDQDSVFDEINQWWQSNAREGKASLLMAYSLGKAQRIFRHINREIGPVYTHGAIFNSNEILQPQTNFDLSSQRITSETKKAELKNALIIAPPSAINSSWSKKLKPYSLGIASGWMALRGARRRRAADRGFILSDHADWKELNETIQLSQPENIITTHGYTDIFTKWLNDQGYNAVQEKTLYTGEMVDEKEDGGEK